MSQPARLRTVPLNQQDSEEIESGFFLCIYICELFADMYRCNGQPREGWGQTHKSDSCRQVLPQYSHEDAWQRCVRPVKFKGRVCEAKSSAGGLDGRTTYSRLELQTHRRRDDCLWSKPACGRTAFLWKNRANVLERLWFQHIFTKYTVGG